jgi:hypothetical protein
VIATPLLVRLLRQPEQLAGASPADWELILRQAALANLTPALYYLLEGRGLLAAVSAPTREHLEWARAAYERHAQGVRFEVLKIRQALASTGVPVLLLKGAAYTMAQLPAAAGRLFTDVDVLVPKERLPVVEGALILAGWACGHHDAYDQRYYREWMHELPPMEHFHRRSLIDVHHALLPETAKARPDPAKLRASARPVDGDATLQVLAPVDMVLHSAVHLFYDGELEHGLRDLLDLHRLLGDFGRAPMFWEELPVRARELELARPLFYALRYTASVLQTPIPAGVSLAAEAGRPNPVLLALMDQLFGRALLPAHASCADWFTGTARFALYVRSNWLRMPPLMLVRHLFHKAFISPKHEKPA